MSVKTNGKKKKKRLRIFYPIYFAVMIAAVAAVFFVCDEIRDRLDLYEASLPKYVAEDVARMFMEKDFERIYAYQDPADFAGEGAEIYANYMNDFTANGELTWGESYSTNEDEMVYAVRLDGKRLFEFTLTKNEEKETVNQWELTDVRTLGVSTATHTVKAPSDSTVYLRGEALGAEAVIESGIAVEDEDFLLGEDAASPTMCVYQFETCFGEPELRVVDGNGVENQVETLEDGSFEAAFNSDEALKAETEERVVEITKAFANFTSEDLNQYKMLKYVRKGTNGYDKIERFDNDWFGKHDGYDFENMETDNYMRFSEDTFACDIHFDYVIKYEKADDLRYETNYRFYLVERDGKWYLYDFKMVS